MKKQTDRGGERPARAEPEGGVAEPPKGRRGRERSQDAHRRILEAALAQLTNVGFRGLTVEGVAADANVAKTTIYRWWPDKTSLTLAALEQLPEMRQPDTGTLLGDLVELRAELEQIVDKHNLGSVLPVMAAEVRRQSEMAGRIAAYVAQREEPVVEAVRRAVARKELPPRIDVHLAAVLLNGPLLHSIFFSPTVLAEESYIRTCRVVIAGLRAKGRL